MDGQTEKTISMQSLFFERATQKQELITTPHHRTILHNDIPQQFGSSSCPRSCNTGMYPQLSQPWL